MKLKLLFFALALMCTGGILNAQSIWTNPITDTNPSATNPYTNGQTVVANLTVSGITRAAGLTAAAATDRFSASNWSTAAAIDLTKYFEFTLTPASGYYIDFVNLVYTSQASGTGPANFALRSSADSYGANIATTTTTTGATFSLAAAAFQHTSAITFRLYGWGAGATGGTFSVNDFTFNGVVSNAFVTAQNGAWTSGATWVGGVVPGNANSAIVKHAVTDNVGITRNSGTTTTINTGASLTVSNGYSNNGTTTVNGTFTVNGSNGATIATGSTFLINGAAVIGSGGYFNTNAPIYGSASLLNYAAGGTYGRGFEWNALGVGTIGTTPGYPNNVQFSNNTTFNYNNGTPNARAIAGTLTVDAGSSFYMDFGGGNSGGALTIAGSLVNNGNFKLGNQNFSDDLRLGGDLTNAGTFDGNGRAVFFIKTSGVQTITATSPSTLTIPYVVFDSSGNREVRLGSNVTISAPNGGNAIAFNSASDFFGLNGKTLTIGTAAVANAITGAGTFSGTTASNLTLLGTGSIGTLSFTTGSQVLNTFTINRTNGATAAVLGTPLVLSGGLVLTNGRLSVGNNALTLGATCTVTSSASNYVIADRANGTAAALRKVFTAAPVSPGFVFPIGDDTASANGSEYSPVTAIIASGTFAANAYVSTAVNDIKQANLDAANDYITRFWDISTSGITAATGFTASGTYLDADVNTPANEATYQGNKWNGTAWSDPGLLVNAAANTTPNIPCVAGATNNITAGTRDAEINVLNVATSTNYPTASTYNFGSVLVGANATVTLTIQNTGQQGLTVNAATTSPNTAPFSYTPYTAGTIAGPTGTQTFTVTFTPTAGGTFNASISIPNSDTTGGENPYVINFTGIGVVPTPEINIKGATGGTNSIVSGSTTANSLNNTLFAATNIGSSQTKDFEIQNLGTATLNLTGTPLVSVAGANPGDFSISTVPPTNAIGASASTIFNITFSPTASGIRTAIISIANNDSDENPYTFLVQGNGTCAAATNTVTPASGPIGTVVTITASANNLTGATVTFGGISAAVTQVSATQITAVVPAGAASGNLITTNAQGCQATNTFTVITNVATGCQGTSGSAPGELFITEVTDATVGGLSYVEIYNATASSINMAGYQLRTHSNGSPTASNSLTLGNFNLAPNGVYVVALGISASPSSADTCTGVTGGNGQLANISTTGGGINFDPGGNDFLGLYKISAGAFVDVFGTLGSATWADGLGLGDRGATFRRKNNVTVPTTTYSNSDWNIIDWAGSGATSCGSNDYTDIGTFNFISGTPPTITLQPTFTPSCKQVSFTVAATEGYAGGNPLAYQWYEVAPGASTWTQLTNTGIYSGVNTATLTLSSITGLTGYQYYVQVRENTATCYTASRAVMITGVQTVTWNGTSWAPSVPNSGTPAIINGNYTTAVNGSFEACSLTVNGTRTLVISPNTYVSVVNDLTVLSTGTLQVQNNGSLVMVDDTGVVTNNGTMQVARTTTPFRKYDYTYWSSPVANTTLGAAMPGWRLDYSWTYNTAVFYDVTGPNGTGTADGFDDANAVWVYAGPGATMTPAKGYAVMTPTSLPSFPATSTVTFSGAVNNGVISIPMALSANTADNADDYNLVGNPYPSSIFADDFINVNTNTSGTLFFWTHSTPIASSAPGPDQYNFETSDYAMYNLSGGVASSNGGAIPSGYVASGQGFMVEANTATSLVFRNSMRNKAYSNTNFYRNANAQSQSGPLQKDRVWLNFQHSIGLFSQALVCYTPDATLDADRGYDGIVVNAGNSVSFYSFIEADKYRIQGRPAFSESDVVPLGVTTELTGTYTISIAATDGALSDASVPIYLEDKLLNVIHDLKQGPYSFNVAVGATDNRFQLRYSDNALGNPDLSNPDNHVLAFSADNSVHVRSGSSELSEVEVYDLLGRSIATSKSINANAVSIPLSVQEQALLVRIKLVDGTRVVRKIVR